MSKAAVGIVLGMAVGGCRSSVNVMGTWSNPEQHITVQFNPDGTFTQRVKHGIGTVICTGHYSVSGSRMHLKFENVSIAGLSPAVQNEVQGRMPKVVGTESDSNLELVTPDRLNITDGGVMQTFDREKGA